MSLADVNHNEKYEGTTERCRMFTNVVARTKAFRNRAHSMHGAAKEQQESAQEHFCALKIIIG